MFYLKIHRKFFSESSCAFPELLFGFYLKDTIQLTIFLFILMLDYLEPVYGPPPATV